MAFAFVVPVPVCLSRCRCPGSLLSLVLTAVAHVCITPSLFSWFGIVRVRVGVVVLHRVDDDDDFDD